MSTTVTAPISPTTESALPATAKVPERIPGERPTAGIPFGRLLAVELRKMVDTRAGRWLLIGIGAIIAIALTIMFFNESGHHRFEEYLQATTMPMAILLPVVGILAVTAEWSQRTGLVTYTLEPRRSRVTWAKFLGAMLAGAAAMALSIALAAVVHQAAITIQGYGGDWSIDGDTLLGASLFVLLGIAQGLGFGMLLRNTPAAIVLYFVLPTAWAILGDMVSWLDGAASWLDLNRTMNALFLVDSMSGEQWAQLGTSVAAWVALPVAVGMWMLHRAEVK
ncbi:ABC transporter permease subunit [Intrasporangium calvum]|uniref:ABC transporter permease subunit n=1 Tax=Intrasporangium calvum TaxID=53358 RepID=A0ABT5GEP4_9MICO|nr:ABC transporter permease subunit [Intrasporangium calvum]MDC5696679.1 ABC transporter permease subunit [Intrasporangium calvum]